jgi:hypothetical protein
MEDAMKAFIVLGAAIMLSGATVFGQSPPGTAGGDRSTLARLESYRECELQKLERRLLVSLNHDVEGVVVTTLREIAKIKLAQPACHSEQIAVKVDDLVTNGATPAIQYKAYLTKIVLSSPRAFADEGITEYKTDEQFFTALARRLEMVALRDER